MKKKSPKKKPTKTKKKNVPKRKRKSSTPKPKHEPAPDTQVAVDQEDDIIGDDMPENPDGDGDVVMEESAQEEQAAPEPAPAQQEEEKPGSDTAAAIDEAREQPSWADPNRAPDGEEPKEKSNDQKSEEETNQ
jgi:hypothetical protein